MALSKQAVSEFRQIYHQHYKVLLDETDSEIMAQNFLNLFKTIYQPIHGDLYEKSIPPQNKIPHRKS